MPRSRTPQVLLSAVAALSLLAGCAADDGGNGSSASPAVSTSAPVIDIATTPMSQADADAFDKAVQGVLSEPDGVAALAPGTWVGVWDPDRGYFMKVYGSATLDGEPANLEQHHRIGSISKTYTATAVLLLVDEGTLTLDDTVADVLPDIASGYPAYADVTVEQLLRMQSGVPDFLNVADGLIKLG